MTKNAKCQYHELFDPIVVNQNRSSKSKSLVGVDLIQEKSSFWSGNYIKMINNDGKEIFRLVDVQEIDAINHEKTEYGDNIPNSNMPSKWISECKLLDNSNKSKESCTFIEIVNWNLETRKFELKCLSSGVHIKWSSSY